MGESLVIDLFARFRSVEGFVLHSNPVKAVSALNFEWRDFSLCLNVKIRAFFSVNWELDLDSVSVVLLIVFPFPRLVVVNVHKTIVFEVPPGCGCLGLTSLRRGIDYIGGLILAAENLLDRAGWLIESGDFLSRSDLIELHSDLVFQFAEFSCGRLEPGSLAHHYLVDLVIVNVKINKKHWFILR